MAPKREGGHASNLRAPRRSLSEKVSGRNSLETGRVHEERGLRPGGAGGRSGLASSRAGSPASAPSATPTAAAWRGGGRPALAGVGFDGSGSRFPEAPPRAPFSGFSSYNPAQCLFLSESWAGGVQSHGPPGLLTALFTRCLHFVCRTPSSASYLRGSSPATVPVRTCKAHV